MFDRTIAALLLLAGMAWARPALAAEGYSNCTGFITSLPAVVSTQGTWCLNQDLATSITSGDAITIATNNVTIDCNDFKLGGLGAGTGTGTYGLFSSSSLNTTVRHCNIRGFYFGLQFYGGSGHAVEDNRFDGNTHVAAWVEGTGSVVRGNLVAKTGGSTANNFAYGLVVRNAVDVIDNTISGVQAGSNGNATGIDSYFNSGAVISGNRVRGVVKNGAGQAKGIFNLNSGRLMLTDNHVVDKSGLGSVGIECDSSDSLAARNVVSGFTTAIYTCGDAGGNFVKP